MDRLLNVTTAVSIVLLLMVLFSIRRAHIRVEYSMKLAIGGISVCWRFHAPGRRLNFAIGAKPYRPGRRFPAGAVLDRRLGVSDHVFPLLDHRVSPARR